MTTLHIQHPLQSVNRETPLTVNYYLYRPLIEVSKIAVAALYGAIHGATQAKDVICTIGAPAGVFSALIAISIRSGQADAPISNLYKNYFQIPITHLAKTYFLKPESLPPFTNILNSVNSWLINSSPQEYFFSSLLQGSLLHEALSSQPLAAKQGILSSQDVEDFVFKIGIIKKKEKNSTYYAETAARVAAWASSLATVTLLIEILRYGFDTNTYQNHTFSEHVNSNIINPILKTYNLRKSFFTKY